MKLTFFKGVALGAAVSVLTLTATAALAGTGVGGVFNLGKKNSVNASTKLTGRVSGPALQLTNTSTNTKAAGLEIRVATGMPPLVVNSATEVPGLNAGLLDGQPASAFLPASQVAGGRVTEADNGSQGLMLNFTNWDLRGTCNSGGGTTDLVTHSIFFGTMNVIWSGPGGVSTATLVGGGQEASIIPLTTSSNVTVIQLDDGTNLTTIIASQVFNSGAHTCAFTAHEFTSG